MSAHNSQHEKTKEELLKYIHELNARMEEVQARVSALRYRHRSFVLPTDELEKTENELSLVISELDEKRAIDWTRTLPDELLMNIVRFLHPKYMYEMSNVSRRWASLMKQPPMAKLERALRWTSNNAKYLRGEVVLPNMIVPRYEYIAHEGGKVYLYVSGIIVDERKEDLKQIVSHDGTVAIVDPNMTGVFTVHEGAVYYAVHQDDYNSVVKYQAGALNVISDTSYNKIQFMVVHGKHLCVVTEQHALYLLDRHNLKQVYNNPTALTSDKIISCKDYLISLHGGLLTTITVQEDGQVIKNRMMSLTTELVQMRTGGLIIDIAATEKGELCIFGERVFTGSQRRSFVLYMNKDTKQFSDPIITHSELRGHQYYMGVTGDNVYVNLRSGDVAVVNLKNMQSTLVRMKTPLSRVILTPDQSLFGFLRAMDQIRIIRLYWD